MQYTKEEVIQFTINILSGIHVTALEIDEIGIPIRNAVQNLEVLKEMIAAEKQTSESNAEEAEDGREADAE